MILRKLCGGFAIVMVGVFVAVTVFVFIPRANAMAATPQNVRYYLSRDIWAVPGNTTIRETNTPETIADLSFNSGVLEYGVGSPSTSTFRYNIEGRYFVSLTGTFSRFNWGTVNNQPFNVFGDGVLLGSFRLIPDRETPSVHIHVDIPANTREIRIEMGGNSAFHDAFFLARHEVLPVVSVSAAKPQNVQVPMPMPYNLDHLQAEEWINNFINGFFPNRPDVPSGINRIFWTRYGVPQTALIQFSILHDDGTLWTCA